jgi:hypothetical protein
VNGGRIALVLSVVGLLGLGALAQCEKSRPPQTGSATAPPANSPGPRSVEIAGKPELVFDWSEEACEELDYPDLPARAYRGEGGAVHLFSSHFVTRRWTGESLDRLVHDCPVVARSDERRRPAAFDNREWLATPYTPDGRTVYALVHNEFQGNLYEGARCPSGDYEACWYNALTLAVSRDGGQTFDDARPAPHHLVAAYPSRYVPDGGPVGLFEPSNIVRNQRDGRYYTFARVVGPDDRPRGACLLRTHALGDPSSWRGWDGDAFTVRFANPYRSARGGVCQPLEHDRIEEMTQSLTFNTFFNRFLLVGTASIPGSDSRTWGIQFTLSKDLVHWTRRRLIMEVETPWTHRCGDRRPVLYPSVLDPSSTSRNFETTGRDPYLYLTRFNYEDCEQGPDRDLIRIPLRLSR